MINKDKIVIRDNVLDPDQCSHLIEIFERENAVSKPNSKVLSIQKHPHLDIITGHSTTNFKTADYWAQIVKRSKGQYQKLHTDEASETTLLTSVTFLNDNFEGGELAFNDLFVKPKAGRQVMFDGQYYPHAVMEIINGDRYTVNCWYDTHKPKQNFTLRTND